MIGPHWRKWMVLVVAAGFLGCKSESTPPTAKAPPTLTNINRPAADDDSDDDSEDDDDYEPARFSSRRGPGTVNLKPGRVARSANRRQKAVFTSKGVKTINGHPNGPRAEVFNAVINSVFPRVSSCFQSQMDSLGQGDSSIRVSVKVARSGSVSAAEVVGGESNRSVRSCVTSAVRSLRFPAYQGKEVSQVIPFTFRRVQ